MTLMYALQDGFDESWAYVECWGQLIQPAVEQVEERDYRHGQE